MTHEENEIEELVEQFREVLNKVTEPPEFSHEQYMASDTQAQDDGAMTVMENLQFKMTHAHGESPSVLLAQRFVKQLVNENGATERFPQQVSMLIPASRLINVIEELIFLVDHLGLGLDND